MATSESTFDPCLVRIVAERLRGGQQFDSIVEEQHAALIQMSESELRALQREAEEKRDHLDYV